MSHSIKFEQIADYNKDLKNLLKRFRSLDEDIEVVKQVLSVFPDERPPYSFRIDNLGIASCIIKMKRIACKSLKGRGVNSGLRLIYAYFPNEHKIVFIELYYKGDKTIENRQRILTYFH